MLPLPKIFRTKKKKLRLGRAAAGPISFVHWWKYATLQQFHSKEQRIFHAGSWSRARNFALAILAAARNAAETSLPRKGHRHPPGSRRAKEQKQHGLFFL